MSVDGFNGDANGTFTLTELRKDNPDQSLTNSLRAPINKPHDVAESSQFATDNRHEAARVDKNLLLS